MARILEHLLALGPEAPARARRSVAPLRGRMDEESFQALELLVSEVVTNSVRHTGRPTGDPILLRVEDEHGRVRVEVVDRGPGVRARSRPVQEASEEETSGWGLFLVNQLTERWGWSMGPRARVWFELEYTAPRRSPELQSQFRSFRPGE